MKLVITDTSGEQVVIDTNGKTDGQQAAVPAQPDNGLGKQTEQKPQQSAQAATNDKKNEEQPGERAKAENGSAQQTKQIEQNPKGSSGADTGAMQAAQKPQQSPQAAVNDKKDEQRPEQLTEPGNGVRQTEQKPQQSAQAPTNDKKNEEHPAEPAKAENGGTRQTKQTEQKPQQLAPADAHGPKTEQKSPDSKAEPLKNVPHSRRTIVLAAVVLVALAVSGYIVRRVFFAKPKLPDSIVTLSGRIEGDDSAIAAKTTGRILESDSAKVTRSMPAISSRRLATNRYERARNRRKPGFRSWRPGASRPEIRLVFWISNWSRISFKPHSRK
jgi:hypothetical protein